MTESGQVERAARRAIALAKARGDADVTPDDLLLGALSEVSRFGIAWIGERAVDVHALADDRMGEPATQPDAAADGPGGEDAPGPAYGSATVELFERAAALARTDGAGSIGLVHLLVAFTEVECGLMARLLREHEWTKAEWRAELARGAVGVPPRLAGARVDGAGGGLGPGSGGPEILGVDDAAEYLDVHTQTVRNYIRSGKLPAYRLAGERYIRVLRADLLSLLERVLTDEPDTVEETTRTKRDDG